MRTSRAPRVVRAALAASVATFAALLSHVVAGGAVPGPLGVAVPWLLSLAVCTVLTGRRLSLLRLSIAVPLSQTLFHVLFVVGAGSAQPVTPHAHHTLFELMPEATMLAPVDPAMWLGHAVAAILTVALVHRGERTMAALAVVAANLTAWLRRRVWMPPILTGFPAPARPHPAADAVPLLVPRLGADAVDRRGPPSPAVA